MNDTQKIVYLRVYWQYHPQILSRYTAIIHPSQFGNCLWFRTVWDWSKGRTKPLEPMYIGLVQFGYFCGLVLVWTGSELNRGNTTSTWTDELVPMCISTFLGLRSREWTSIKQVHIFINYHLCYFPHLWILLQPRFNLDIPPWLLTDGLEQRPGSPMLKISAATYKV